MLQWLPVIGPAVQKLLDLIPDPNAKAKAAAEFQNTVFNAVVKEASDHRETNKIEAQHQSLFVAGWRPCIGWVCAAALTFEYIIRPFWVWVILTWYPTTPIPPSMNEVLWELLFGMLGLGTLRTIDKRGLLGRQ